MKIFIFFCNTFNLEDDCFVHNSVVSFLFHQAREKSPKKAANKISTKKQGVKKQ